MQKRCLCMLFSAFMMLLVAGCGLYTAGSIETVALPEQSYVYPSTFAYSFVGDIDTYVPSQLQTQMDGFGPSRWIEQATAEIQLYTQIPEVENNANGTDPICVVIPELDLSKYSGPYQLQDETTDLTVYAYYRTIADVITDESVRVYVDTDGNIRQYETVNFGKYDWLDQVQVESMRLALRGRENNCIADVIGEHYVPVVPHAPSAYMLFTDTQGQIVLSTRGVLKTDSQIPQTVTYVDLYAIIDPGR